MKFTVKETRAGIVDAYRNMKLRDQTLRVQFNAEQMSVPSGILRIVAIDDNRTGSADVTFETDSEELATLMRTRELAPFAPGFSIGG
jgi:hypothetical protein